jgi:hypothetical protein
MQATMQKSSTFLGAGCKPVASQPKARQARSAVVVRAQQEETVGVGDGDVGGRRAGRSLSANGVGVSWWE